MKHWNSIAMQLHSVHAKVVKSKCVLLVANVKIFVVLKQNDLKSESDPVKTLSKLLLAWF